MKPTSYGPTEPHLWLVGKIPPKTWEICNEMSERKSQTHSYNELIDLLMELAMEKEDDSHMDKYLRKHVRRYLEAWSIPKHQVETNHALEHQGGQSRINLCFMKLLYEKK